MAHIYLSVTKKYSTLSTYILPLAIAFLTHACASIVALQGGPEDKTPPQVTSTYPLNGSNNNFQGNKVNPVIRLTFDKDIQVQNLYTNLIVNPKLPVKAGEASYVHEIKGNSLELRLNVPLEKETTYTFNFKDTIRDTRESTPAENPTLTFSTGQEIDALYVTGQVTQLMTGQPASKALVALYKLLPEAASPAPHILTSAPDYFTETNEDGTFRLEHLRAGSYMLCTGKSKENKLTIDPGKEMYGFLATPLVLTESIEGIPLSMVKANINELKVQNAKPQGPYFEINLSKPVSTYTLQLVHPPKRLKDATLYAHLIEEENIIRVYNTLGLLADDVLEAKLEAADDLGNALEQTIKIQFKDRRIDKNKFKYTLNPTAGTKVDARHLKISLQFNKPVKNVQPNSLFIVTAQGSTVSLDPDEVTLQPHQDVVIIQKELPVSFFLTPDSAPGKESDALASFMLQINQGAFVSVEKEVNEAATIKYIRKLPEECGSIQGRITTQSPGFVIQLLDKDYQVIDEIRNQKRYKFNEVIPGNYWIRVLASATRSGQWKCGDINKMIPPDPVIFYPSPLAIVAKWEMEGIDLEW